MFHFQKKLEGELQQIEEKFEAKKRKFIESSEVFQEELKKVKKQQVDALSLLNYFCIITQKHLFDTQRSLYITFPCVKMQTYDHSVALVF